MSARLVLGRDRYARIGAVDRIALTTAMRAMLHCFDREGLSAAERRCAIIKRDAPTRHAGVESGWRRMTQVASSPLPAPLH